MLVKRILLSFLLVALMIATGCGGGGGGGTGFVPVTDSPVVPQPDVTSKLVGTVTDSAKASMSGVSIIAYDANGSSVASATSNSDGTYELTLPYDQQVDVVFSHPSIVLNGPASGKLGAGETRTMDLSAASAGYPPLPVRF